MTKQETQATKNTNNKRPMEEILDTHIYLNWFGVYTDEGILLNRPTQEKSCFYPDFDQDVEDGQKEFEELLKAVVFPDFYQDDQIGIVTLLRNDNLEITLTVLNIHSKWIEFVEAKTLGELLVKFPKLQRYIKGEVLKKLESPHYHPNN